MCQALCFGVQIQIKQHLSPSVGSYTLDWIYKILHIIFWGIPGPCEFWDLLRQCPWSGTWWCHLCRWHTVGTRDLRWPWTHSLKQSHFWTCSRWETHVQHYGSVCTSVVLGRTMFQISFYKFQIWKGLSPWTMKFGDHISVKVSPLAGICSKDSNLLSFLKLTGTLIPHHPHPMQISFCSFENRTPPFFASNIK